MDRLLLVRHAVTSHTGSRLSGHLPGLHLTKEGRAQAETLADLLDGTHLDAVYTSPLERCQETAAALTGPRGLKVGTLDGVAEVDYGEWTGRTLDELRGERLWAVVQTNPSGMRFPGGETLHGVQARAVATVEELRGRHQGQTVAVVSHADVIKALVAHYVGLHLDLFQRLQISPASVTTLDLRTTPTLTRLNETGGARREQAHGAGGASDGTA